MTTVAEAIDMLRGRLTRLRQGRSLSDLESETGLHRNTWRQFLRGDNLTQKTLGIIESWCNAQEATPAPGSTGNDC